MSEQEILTRIRVEREVRVDSIEDQEALRCLIERGVVGLSETGDWCGIAPTPEEEARLNALRAQVYDARDELAMKVTLGQIRSLPESLERIDTNERGEADA